MSDVTEEMLDVFTKRCWGPDAYTADEYKAGFQALFDAGLIALPSDAAEVREAAIRECIAALPPFVTNAGDLTTLDLNRALEECYSAIQSLLPTKDRAEELAEAFAADTSDAGGSEVVANGDHHYILKHFARWVLSRGEG